MPWLKLFKTDSGSVSLGQAIPVLLLGKNIMISTSISRFAGCV